MNKKTLENLKVLAYTLSQEAASYRSRTYMEPYSTDYQSGFEHGFTEAIDRMLAKLSKKEN